MQGKYAVSFILFFFPALMVPLFLVLFLTRIPGDLGAFFNDYSFAFVWGLYALIAIAAVIFFSALKRRSAQQALADGAASETSADESPALVAESPQE